MNEKYYDDYLGRHYYAELSDGRTIHILMTEPPVMDLPAFKKYIQDIDRVI